MRARITTPFLDVDVGAAPGEIVAVVGPNGAGKSTLLRALAGLLPATGSLELGGRDVMALPVHARGTGWVPQGTSLFGHLSARDNAAYALRAAGVRRSRARAEGQAQLDRLGVGELGDARPRTLSGGQAARVALARALVGAPQLLLLDEPLAALDSATRDDVRRLLRTTLSGGPAAVLMVTHDPVDVVALADRLVVLEGGRVVQDATPGGVTLAPRSAWVARMLGQNAWHGTADATGLLVSPADDAGSCGGQVVAAEPLPGGTPALALVEPSAVTLHRSRPEGSARTVLHGEVGELRSLGGRVRVVVRSTPQVVAEVTVAAAADLRLIDGGSVWASVKATEVRLVAL